MKLFRLILTVAIALSSLLTLPQVQAADQPVPAKPITMKVNVTVDNPDIFWSYTFLTKDTVLAKPDVVKLTWSQGEVPKGEKTQTILTKGKLNTIFEITSNKNDLINLEVFIQDGKGNKLGEIGLNVKNNGQTENITISPPDYTEPKIVWGNL